MGTPVVRWHAVPQVPLRNDLESLDPDRTSPLTSEEIVGMSANQVRKLEAVFPKLRDADVVVRERQRLFPKERGGTKVSADVDGALAFGSDRAYSSDATILSQNNLVTPLFSKALVGAGPDEYNTQLLQAVEQAQKLVVVTAFGLDNPAFVDQLIEKAKQGVPVHVLVDPVDTPDEQSKGEALQRMRDAALDTLHIVEFPVLPGDSKRDEFPQILHVKKMICDTPDGSLVELSGGINFGEGSSNNVDTGWRIEGPAVLDSLRFFCLRYLHASNRLPFDPALVPSEKQIVEKTAAKLRRGQGVEIELASTERRRVQVPKRPTPKSLRERAKKGQDITISSKTACMAGMPRLLEVATKNGSRVEIIEEPMGALETAIYRKVLPELRKLGVRTLSAEGLVFENSYRKLVLRELDQAIKNKESVQVAAFALTDGEVLDRLLAAKRAGCDVQVVVDDLTIDGSFVNRKAIALLTAAKIPVKAFDRRVATQFAEKIDADPRHVKLHSKMIILGGNRVLAGSANFSESGLGGNEETGRLLRSTRLAKGYQKGLFAPLWKAAVDVRPTVSIPREERVPLLTRPGVQTPIEDIIFVVFDLETTGFRPDHDERILGMTFRAVRIKNGKAEVLDEVTRYVLPGTDALGRRFDIPARSVAVHGLDHDTLIKKGAVGIGEATRDVLDMLERLQGQGNIVLAGQNVPFDLRFVDYLLSRPELARQRSTGRVNYRIEPPFVDTVQLSAALFPNEMSHDLDALLERLGIPQRTDLPRHDAYADVVYTTEALIALIARSEASVLGDILAQDEIRITKPTRLWANAQRDAAPFALEFSDRGSLRVVLEEEKAKRNVNRIKVVDVEGGYLKVQLSITWNGGERVIDGFLDPKDVRFYLPGVAYEKLREMGIEPAPPAILELATSSLE